MNLVFRHTNWSSQASALCKGNLCVRLHLERVGINLGLMNSFVAKSWQNENALKPKHLAWLPNYPYYYFRIIKYESQHVRLFLYTFLRLKFSNNHNEIWCRYSLRTSKWFGIIFIPEECITSVETSQNNFQVIVENNIEIYVSKQFICREST